MHAALPIDKLLPRLDRVHQRAPGQLSARCPAHEDRGPSLSIKVLDDGKLLLRCFAGCSASEVVGAVGLDLADLFPARAAAPGAGAGPQRLKLPASQALEILAFEASVVAVIAGDMVANLGISGTDQQRLIQAVGRIQYIAEATS